MRSMILSLSDLNLLKALEGGVETFPLAYHFIARKFLLWIKFALVF